MAQKEVYYWEYCKQCKYENTKEEDEPCRLCLCEPSNDDSHKPILFKEKGKSYK